ncbi:hypothetical protein [Kribbella yunnanensis]
MRRAVAVRRLPGPQASPAAGMVQVDAVGAIRCRARFPVAEQSTPPEL